MLKTIKKYIKSEIDLNRELTGYIRTGTAVGIVGSAIALYLVAKELLERAHRREEKAKEIDDLADEIGEIGNLLVKAKVVPAEDIAEIGVLAALQKAIEEHEKS